MIVGIDAGNNAVKVASAYGLDRFPSVIGEYRERNIENEHGNNDIVFEYKERKGFAGTLAEAESEFSGSLMGDSKAHEDAKLRILIALHRLNSNSFKVIVGQPISKHEPNEKELIKKMLVGTHEITVNGVRKVLKIERVEVAAEGGAAFWSSPCDGLVRIIDVGSATVNCASLIDGRYVDRDSLTLPFGCNTVKTNKFEEMARGIVTYTSKKWKPQDTVLLVGGASEKLLKHIQVYYPDSAELTPIFQAQSRQSIFANAIGFYNIGRTVYG